MRGPTEIRLLGSRLDRQEAEALAQDPENAWRVAGPAAEVVWWAAELAASSYSAELIGPAMGPLWPDHPFADVPDALYRVAYGRSIQAALVLFHAHSGARYQMTAEVFRIHSGSGLIDWRLGKAEAPPKLTITAEGTYDDWLAELPALARTAQRIFRRSSQRGRPPGTRDRSEAQYREAERRLTDRLGRPPTIEELAEEAIVSESSIKRWRQGL